MTGPFSIDELAKQINREIKSADEESFVIKKSKASELLQLKFDIVKDVIQTRLALAEKNERKAILASRRRENEAALKDSTHAALKGKSPEELEKMLKELDAED